MSRRLPNLSRRLANGGGVPFVGAIHAKTHASPLLSIGLLVGGAILLIFYSLHGSGTSNIERQEISKLEGLRRRDNLFTISCKGKIVYTYVDPHSTSLVRERFAQRECCCG